MTQEQIFSKVQDIIVNKLDYIEMVMDAEKAFGIIVPDEQTSFKDTVTVKEYCEELEKIINKQ